MWENYFGSKCKFIGLDINPRCKSLEERIQIVIGDQTNRFFLRQLIKEHGPFDIVLDDGGHTMQQQIISFEELFPAVKENGIYLVEDLHTSYWKEYGGGYLNKSSFIEYSKNLIDFLNAWHSRDNKLQVNNFTRSANSLHFYDSILVIEKQPRDHPKDSMTGNKSF